jgi:hypothetical protein
MENFNICVDHPATLCFGDSFQIAFGYWIVPLALRASFHSLSANVNTTYASYSQRGSL